MKRYHAKAVSLLMVFVMVFSLAVVSFSAATEYTEGIPVSYKESYEGYCTLKTGVGYTYGGGCIAAKMWVNNNPAVCAWQARYNPLDGTVYATKYYLSQDALRSKLFYWLLVANDETAKEYKAVAKTYWEKGRSSSDTTEYWLESLVHSGVDYLQQNRGMIQTTVSWRENLIKLIDEVENWKDVPNGYKVFYYYPEGSNKQSIMSCETPIDIRLIKRSTNPEVTNGNPNYSFEGIQYYFSKGNKDAYFKTTSDNYVGMVKLDKNGEADTYEGSRKTLRFLSPGTYYVREYENNVRKASGYKLNPKIYTVTVTADNSYANPVILEVEDEPEILPNAKIIKKSANPEITDGNECYSVKGAKFNVYKTMTDARGKTNAYKENLETDDEGVAVIEAIEPGTYYVREIEAPKGYELSDDIATLVVKDDTESKAEVVIKNQPGNDPAVLSIYKNDPDHVEKDEHGNDVKKPIPGVEFEICYYDADPTTTLTLEDLGDKTPKRTWVIKTDSNGGAALGNKWKVDGSDDFYYQYNAAGQPFGNAVVPIGCLTLTEKQEAPGYYKDTTVRFARVTEDMAKNNELIKFSDTALTNDSIDYPNYETVTHVSKKDITTQEEKPGAHLKVTDKDGAVVDSWISTDEEHIIKGLTVGETYTLTETLAPDGYVTSSDVTFTVLDGGKVTTVIMYDDITKYEFIKVDENGKPLTGAVLKVEEVSDREGKFVEEWTTDGTAHKIYGKLVVGRTYKFSEVKAPAGYVLAKPEIFVVGNNSELHTLTAKNVLTETLVSKKSITTMEELPGAELVVTDKDGKEVDKWTSTNEEHNIKGLNPGETYTLTETIAPDGYVISNSIQFTVNTDGTVTEVEMVDDTTKFEFIKVNTKGEPVEGCVLRIEHFKGVYAVDAATPDEIVTQEVWEPVEGEEWTTDEEDTPHVVHAKLVVGERYRLVEVSAPEDYALAKPVEFTVENTAETVEIKMVNTVTSVTKTDINGDKEVPGATLIVRDKDGNIVDQWVSTDEAHHVKNLTVGETYTLEESIPAPGYVTADPIEFTVTEDGVDTDLTMKDAPTKVVVRKLDDSNKPVKGAKLQLLDKDKKVIDEWVSDGTDHLIEGKLVVGETYTLHEVSAPTGYELAKDIEFTVKDTADKQEIRMVDVYKVSTPDQPTSPPNSGTVKSGQGTWGLMIAVGVILLSVACVAFFRRKKENEI